MNHRDAGLEIDAALQRHFRPGRLSPSQRRRHLAELARAIAAEEEEMEFLRRRGRTELVALIAVLALVVAGVVVWSVVQGGSDEPEETLVAIAAATLTARASSPDVTATGTATDVPAATRVLAEWGGVCEPDSFSEALPVGGPTGDPAYPDWYGNEGAGLWVAPVHRGSMLPLDLPDALSRWFTGHQTFLMWYGSNDPVRVTGELLGGDATIEVPEPDFRNPQVMAQWTNFEFPEPGCWRITGEAGDKALTITVEVLPLDQRPDIIFAQQLRDARPYPAPDSCQATQWIGPESSMNHYVAQNWMDVGGLTIGFQAWPVANVAAGFAVYGEEIGESFTATARHLERPDVDPIVAETSVQSWGRSITYSIPEPGCWELVMVTESASANAVVYVYPEECASRWHDRRAEGPHQRCRLRVS